MWFPSGSSPLLHEGVEVNCDLAQTNALATLLIEKGVITEAEFLAKIA